MALDAYLKIDGIKGDNPDPKHRDWISVESFSWGVSLPGHRPGVTAAVKPTFKVFSVVKLVDFSSPLLMKACALRTRYKTCILEVQESLDEESVIVYGFKLTDCFVASVNSVSPSSLADRAREGLEDMMLEEVAFTFGTIVSEYRPYGDDGTARPTTLGGYSIPASGSYGTPFLSL